MTKKKTLLLIGGIVLALALIVTAVFLLRNVGAGAENRPITLGSAADLKHWFKEGGALSKKDAGTYYFKLTGDMTISAEAMVSGDYTVILDLNGHTITGKKNRAFQILEGAKLTLKNGTVATEGAALDGGVIYLKGASCSFTIEDVTLSNTNDAHISENLRGGVIFADSPVEAPATVSIRGKSVINGASVGNRRSGGSVTLVGGTELYFYDGFIRNGKALSGGNVQLEGQSVLHMLGGTISGGKALRTNDFNGFGGNVNVQALSRVYMYGGYVVDGTAETSGGNLFLSNTGTVEGASGFYMYGGAVEAGVAGYYGGNIAATETNTALHIYDGSIDQGDAMLGGNVYLQGASMEVRGGTFTGYQASTKLAQGGNIYGKQCTLAIYGGLIQNGHALEDGGNVYVDGSDLRIYGGTIVAGAVECHTVSGGGGNVFAGRSSYVAMYGGEIADGISNCTRIEEDSAAGGNVMIAGSTFMEMFGGTIKNGMIYGAITRGGSVYVYGQGNKDNTIFHMYGGTIENGDMQNTMRGQCIGAYSPTNNDNGHGTARLYGGTITYTETDSKNGYYVLHGNKPADMLIYESSGHVGNYYRSVNDPCNDPTHNTKTGTLEATCLTQGCDKYTCDTCGDWYVVTAEPLGHTLTTEAYTDETTGLTCNTVTCTTCQEQHPEEITLPKEQ